MTDAFMARFMMLLAAVFMGAAAVWVVVAVAKFVGHIL